TTAGNEKHFDALGAGLCVSVSDSVLRLSAQFILSTVEGRTLHRQASGSAFFNRGDLGFLHRHHSIPLPLIRLKDLLSQTQRLRSNLHKLIVGNKFDRLLRSEEHTSE